MTLATRSLSRLTPRYTGAHAFYPSRIVKEYSKKNVSAPEKMVSKSVEKASTVCHVK